MVMPLRLVPAPLRRRVLDSAEVPSDLGSVTTIAADEEHSPSSVGMTRDGVEAIWRATERLYATGMHPGISLVLRRHGKIVLKRAIGHARGNGPGDAGATPVPMTPDTPVCIFSASKAMAAMPVHLLSQHKELSLLDPVSHYLPEFGQNGKRDITIYQLLCHKAGIPTIPTEGLDVAELLLDSDETLRRIRKITERIATALYITGPFNIQFLSTGTDVRVIECNLRASRSMPFVSKVLKSNLIELATKVMLGVPAEKLHKSVFELDYVGVKAPQFSFSRLAKADPVLGVDMASTGEVGCIGEGFYEAILKAMFSVGYRVPEKSILLSTGPARSKVELLNSANALRDRGHKLYATRGTQQFLQNAGVEAEVAYWPDENRSPNTIELIRSREVDLVINIPKDLSAAELNNDYQIRRSAVDYNIPLITNARLASAFINAFCSVPESEIEIKAWDEY